MIKAAIFDMDGLLVDTEELWINAYIKILRNHGFTITKADVNKHLGSGLRTSDEIEIWHSIFKWQTPTKDKMEQLVTDEVLSQLKTLKEALPGVQQLVRLLLEHNIPMAIASSSSTEQIELVVKNLSLEKHIKHIHSGAKEPKGKPHPGIYLSAAKSLNVKPSDCLVFEDSLTGLKAAKAAGMKCIAVPRGYYNTAGYDIADVIVKSLEEVNWQTIQRL